MISVDFASFNDFATGFWNCSDNVVFLLDFGTVPTMWYFLLDFGTVPTMWYFLLDFGTVPTMWYFLLDFGTVPTMWYFCLILELFRQCGIFV